MTQREAQAEIQTLEHSNICLTLENIICNEERPGDAEAQLRALLGGAFCSQFFIMLLFYPTRRAVRSMAYRGLPMHQLIAASEPVLRGWGVPAFFPLLDCTAAVLCLSAGPGGDPAGWCAGLETALRGVVDAAPLKDAGIRCALGTVQEGPPNLQQLYRPVQIARDHGGEQSVLSWYSVPWSAMQQLSEAQEKAPLAVLERQFMNHVNNRRFFDAVSALDQITGIRIWQTRAPLSHIRSSVFFRLESVLSTSGVSINPDDTRTEVYDALEQVMHAQSFQALRGASYDVFALLDDLLTRQEAKGKKAAAVKAYIDQHYANPNLDAAVLCGQFKLSEAYMARAFKETYQQSWLDYVHAVRLGHTRDLLEHTDLKLEDLAEAVGFTARTMARLFKAAEGVSPGAYRQGLRKAQT